MRVHLIHDLITLKRFVLIIIPTLQQYIESIQTTDVIHHLSESLYSLPDSRYSWFQQARTMADGDLVTTYNDHDYCFPVMYNNRFNKRPQQFYCELCRTVDELDGNYMSYVTLTDFLNSPTFYIENAYAKSQHVKDGTYDLAIYG